MISALISGVLQDPPWQEFVHQLRIAFNANHANVIFRRPDLRQMFMAQSSDPEVASFGDLIERYDPAADPIPYFRMQPFRGYRIGDFLGGSDPNAHPFTGRFLNPLGMGELAICRVQTETGMQAWLSLTRSGADRFDDNELARMEQLARLYAQALTIFGVQMDLEDKCDAYSRIASAGATGVARLDEQGRVLHLDENARAWVNEGSLLSLAGERLATAKAGDVLQFRSALGRILSGASMEECVVLDGTNGESLELLINRFSDPMESVRTAPPRAIIFMRMFGREPSPSPERLRALFGLTRREAALTVLLSRGQPLGIAAAQLGVSEQTARAYLRQVFSKTGVTRQAELMRRIHGSIARFT